VTKPTLRDIAPDLRSLAVPIGQLTPAPDNARRHADDRDLPVLMESLRRFGQRKPIVAKRLYRGSANAVIAGNGTLRAAQSLGWTHIAVAWFEGSDDDARAYALVDNRSAELSEWNLEQLAAQLADLSTSDTDLPGLLGWDDSSFAALIGAQWEAPSAEPLPTDGAPEPTIAITVTRSQHAVIAGAIDRVRQNERDRSMTDGRCLELICADALLGPSPDGHD
jgi:ParB-like chromosome segregation protein Spo0J